MHRLESNSLSLFAGRGARLRSKVLALLVVMIVSAAAELRSAELRDGEALLWQALASGEAVALMRHALAPGTGDPPQFDIRDCKTQRNLSAAGRAQALATGHLMRKMGVSNARVYTSQWCRCRETAELLGFGEPRELPALNSLYTRSENRDRQSRDIKGFFATLEKQRPPHILVSHQVTIRAFTGDGLPSGGLILVKPQADGSLSVLGRIKALPAN